VYVLDDASTDDSQEAVSEVDGVNFVASDEENAGAAATRNRILQILGYDAIIHFMDADIELLSQETPDRLRNAFDEHPRAAAIGGLILTPDGQPQIFNYGPRYSVYSNIAGLAQVIVDNPEGNPLIRKAVDALTPWKYNEFSDPQALPETKRVFWVCEANFGILSRVFDEVGGFDPKLRFHETQELSLKLYYKDYETWFEPTFAVEHHSQSDKNLSQQIDRQREAAKRIIAKYGLPLK
jgi:N-acetylglucosaminyl-diphospho-decaprenol L-rhamnosyltransferase